MIFLKNTFKKKNVVGYFWTLLVLFLGLLLLTTVQYGLKKIMLEKYHSIEFRTIITEKIEDVDVLESIKKLKCVEEITDNDKDTTKIIINDYRNSKKVTAILADKYDYFVNNMGKNDTMSFLNLINISLFLVIGAVYIIVGIIIFQFNNDDKENMNILRALGYSKIKLFLIQLSCLLLFFTIIFGIDLIIEIILNIFITKYLVINNMVFLYYLFILLSLYLIVTIIYSISYLKINKHMIRNIY